MREIKFRAWATESKEMFYDVGIEGVEVTVFDEALGDWGILGDREENSMLQHCILMQYTGLKDKNGKDIWEEDIVRIAGYGNYIVEWPFIELFQSSFENDVEYVLGNIYENPEFLSKEK